MSTQTMTQGYEYSNIESARHKNKGNNNRNGEISYMLNIVALAAVENIDNTEIQL